MTPAAPVPRPVRCPRTFPLAERKLGRQLTFVSIEGDTSTERRGTNDGRSETAKCYNCFCLRPKRLLSCLLNNLNFYAFHYTFFPDDRSTAFSLPFSSLCFDSCVRSAAVLFLFIAHSPSSESTPWRQDEYLSLRHQDMYFLYLVRNIFLKKLCR